MLRDVVALAAVDDDGIGVIEDVDGVDAVPAFVCEADIKL